jgi:hypothetical protein
MFEAYVHFWNAWTWFMAAPTDATFQELHKRRVPLFPLIDDAEVLAELTSVLDLLGYEPRKGREFNGYLDRGTAVVSLIHASVQNLIYEYPEDATEMLAVLPYNGPAFDLSAG